MEIVSAAPDFGRLAAECAARLSVSRLQRLATELGLTEQSLTRLAVGWFPAWQAWSFPMRRADGTVTGIRLRLLEGRKLSVPGGKEGLFIPIGLGSPTALWVAEGPTDCAALLDMGVEAVGRPSCTGGTRLLVELVKQLGVLQVNVVADNDEPGRRGAEAVAGALLPYVGSVKVLEPPAGVKDTRAWLLAGAARADLDAALNSAAVRRLRFSSRTIHV